MDSLVIEKKERNTAMKKTFMGRIGKIASSFKGGDVAKMNKLHKALVQALEWQQSIEDTKVIKENNRVFYGPHKWIICMLGSDDYTVRAFIRDNQSDIIKNSKEKSNLSISILGLSGQQFKMHVEDYKELVELTKRGNYRNIVPKNTDADKAAAEQFFTAMDVYPSEQTPVIKELFQNI